MIERSRVRVPAGAVGYFLLQSQLSVLTVLPHSYVKDPGHYAKTAGGRIQLNTHALYVCVLE